LYVQLVLSNESNVRDMFTHFCCLFAVDCSCYNILNCQQDAKQAVAMAREETKDPFGAQASCQLKD